MKASLFLVGASAIVASASPIRAPLEKRLVKRALMTEWVYEYVTVTVTEGDIPKEPAPTAPVFLAPEQPAPEPTADPKKPVSRRPKPKPAPKPTYVKPKPKPVKEEPTVVVTTTEEAPTPEPTYVEPEPKPEPEPVKEEPKPEPEPAPTTTKEEPEPAPTKSSSSDGSYDLSLDLDYKSVILNYHNIHRANHSAPDLVWDETLAGYAETIAKGCVFEHDM